MESREQELVNICFSIGLLIQSEKHFRKMNTEKTAEWIASQLELNGFPTQPVGASWGILK